MSWHTTADERADVATEVRLNLVVDGNIVVVVSGFGGASHLRCGGAVVELSKLVAVHQRAKLCLSTNGLLND